MSTPLPEPPKPLWKFPDLLEREGITIYALNKHLGGRVSRNALYKWGERHPESLDFAMAGHVLAALRAMTGKPIALADLVEYPV